MRFSPAALLTQLRELPQPTGYLVAYSGGLDSQVLLHAMVQIASQLAVPVRAIHIQHGLQVGADAWVEHCRNYCQRQRIPLIVEHLQLQVPPGASVEAVAREARYQAIATHLKPHEMLLTAQHADDQAETLMLQLLRGAGLEGLAGMPVCRVWQKGWHARPLLPQQRQTLAAYATEQKLQWIEDPSNQDPRFDRNFLRHQVMPLLQRRWPAAKTTLARSAGHLGSALQAIQSQDQADLAVCLHERGCLEIAALNDLGQARRQRVIRRWLLEQGLAPPNSTCMRRIEQELLPDRSGDSPQLHWQRASIRRYRGDLWLVWPDVPSLPARMHWPDQSELVLPDGSVLRRELAEQGIARCYWQQGRVHVAWRSSGGSCRPLGRRGTRSLKKLFQDLAIPPWQRGQIPLVYVDEHLVSVADLCQCKPQQAQEPGPFYRLCWEQQKKSDFG